MSPITADALAQGTIERGKRPGADPRLAVGCDVRGVDGSKRRIHGQTARVLDAPGRRMTDGTVAGGRDQTPAFYGNRRIYAQVRRDRRYRRTPRNHRHHRACEAADETERQSPFETRLGLACGFLGAYPGRCILAPASADAQRSVCQVRSERNVANSYTSRVVDGICHRCGSRQAQGIAGRQRGGQAYLGRPSRLKSAGPRRQCDGRRRGGPLTRHLTRRRPLIM